MISLHHGNALDVLAQMAEDGALFDSVVCDPPYHLTSIVKRFGAPGAAPAQFGRDGAFARTSRGFRGQNWDGGDIAFQADTWRAVASVMKPGAWLVAFGGARTYHRLACAIEDAGFDVRDPHAWLYGQGMPKSHDVERAIARRLCERPGRHYERLLPAPPDRRPDDHICDERIESAPWAGWGSALKPAFEFIAMARKAPVGTMAENVLAHGVGALNIDACRVQPSERWPATVLHDGSETVMEAFAAFGERPGQLGRARTDGSAVINRVFGKARHTTQRSEPRGDAGFADRFFYCAKATAEDRAGGDHPTVKPVALMRYLVRLVTPRGGHVLDPFAGSGTTGAAAQAEGCSATLIEREAQYAADIRRRFCLEAAA